MEEARTRSSVLRSTRQGGCRGERMVANRSRAISCPHRLDGLVDAGERRLHRGGERVVIEADHGDVFGHSPTRLCQHLQRPGGLQVRRCEHRVEGP